MRRRLVAGRRSACVSCAASAVDAGARAQIPRSTCDSLRSDRRLAARARPRRLHRRRRGRRDGHRRACRARSCCGAPARLQNDDELRIAQVSADDGRDFILFMVQRPDDQVYFYLSTPRGGLQKAFVSIPSKNLVRAARALRGGTALPAARSCYWKDRSDDPLHGSRTPQPDRLPAHRPARPVGRAAEVSLTSRASRSG